MAAPSGRSLRLTNVLLAMVVIALIAAPALNAMGAGSPANKAGATGNKLATVPPSSSDAGTEILSTSIKTSAPEDLIFSLTAECDILTTVQSNGGTTTTVSSSSAQGILRLWVTIDGVVSSANPTGAQEIVPVTTTYTGSPNPQPGNPSPAGGNADKVTFCRHDRGQTVTNAESDGGTDTLQTYLETKTANAFNWVFLNATAGTHNIKVYAQLTGTGGTCTQASTTSCSTGFVGNRTLVIDPAHFASDASVPVST